MKGSMPIMNTKKALFVYNPLSGKGQIRFHLADIIDVLTKGGYDVTAHPTQAKLDAVDVVSAKGLEYDIVVCSGGDGTLNETIEGIMSLDERKPIGYIPAGTMNDFASSLKIPRNMKAAAETIVQNHLIKVDAGSFNDVYFTYIAAFGAFTDVSYETRQEMKNVFGRLAYLMEGMKKLNKIKSYHLKLKYNDVEIEDDFIFGMVSNSNSVAGMKGLSGKEVLLDDGIYECFFIRNPQNLIELQMTVNALLKRELDSEYFYFFKASEIELHCDEEMPWTLDGEYGGTLKDVSIKNNCQAIEIFVPQ
jgi:YegS/Rv2252/BmrU family lipid kinase